MAFAVRRTALGSMTRHWLPVKVPSAADAGATAAPIVKHPHLMASSAHRLSRTRPPIRDGQSVK
jgi:hypothetical protein